MKNKEELSTVNEELILNKYDDQYQQIKDALDITESTDNETTDITDFRVVNKNNPVKELDSETVKKIFSGEITNWKEVGGNDADIIVISRESGSGTRDAFEEMTGLLEEVDGKKMPLLKEDALICEGNGSVKANIESKENSIAYLSLGYVDDTMNAITIDGVEPTVETVKSGEYKISRPLILVTKGEVSEATQKYLDYCLDEGQEIVSESYISIK